MVRRLFGRASKNIASIMPGKGDAALVPKPAARWTIAQERDD
jgi:hypothetical protein